MKLAETLAPSASFGDPDTSVLSDYETSSQNIVR
jgi:hypothetical protein